MARYLWTITAQSFSPDQVWYEVVVVIAIYPYNNERAVYTGKFLPDHILLRTLVELKEGLF